MKKQFDKHITCAFLYSITKYGYPPKADNMVTYIHEMADLGFQSIELEGIGSSHLQVVYQQRKEIKQALENRNLRLPVFCTVLPGIASPHASVARESLDTFKQGCELASYFGARGVLDNGPLLPYDFPADMPIYRHYSPDVLRSVRLPQQLEWNAYWEELLKRMNEACEVAATYGLNYYMHPCVGSLTDTTNGYLLLKKELGCDNLKFNLDTSNLYFMHENLSLSLLKIGKDLDYIHISDSKGIQIEHQPIGIGMINWGSFFETLKEIGFCGELSIDVGGDESHVENIDQAYIQTALFIEKQLSDYEIF